MLEQRYSVSSLDNSVTAELEIFTTGHYALRPCPDNVPRFNHGYFLREQSSTHFIVANKLWSYSGLDMPDWDEDVKLGVDGNVFDARRLTRCSMLDLIFLRRFRAYQGAQCVIEKWYRPGWKDAVIPSDPMMPWGSDFFRFVCFILERRGD